MGISGVWDERQVEADYGWQAFFAALCHAIVSTGALQQRVAAFAWSVADLRREHFDRDETWARFQKLLTSLTGEVQDRKAAITAASRAMSDEQACKWLQEAIQIFSELSQEGEA